MTFLGASIVRSVALRSMAAAVLAIALLFCVTYSVMRSAGAHAVAASVDTDLAGLADIYSSGGRAELISRLQDRLALTATGQRPAHYLLADAGSHRRIAGDLRAWPGLSAEQSQAGPVILDRGHPAFARATRLSPELSLVVAHETGADAALIRQVALAFALTGIAIVLLVGGLAWHSSRRLAARVERINAAYRMPGAAIVDSGKDEIGELARHSAAALDRMGRLMEAQRHVSDNVAHEIRTPLMHLDGRLLALLRREPEGEGAPVLVRARSDLRGIVAMLDSLLDIAASEARRGDVAGLEPVDLSALAGDIAEIYASSMDEAGLRLELVIAPGVTMLGEPMQLARLLSNLLDNAIKYVPSGGTIRIEIDQDGTIRISDDGPGIPHEARAAIFDRFRRGRHEGPAGHGLGLALVRAIAERHGMTIQLEGRDKGCSFVIAPEARP